MIIGKYLHLKSIITLFLLIVSSTVATDCDVVIKFISYIKGIANDDSIQYDNCCSAEDVVKCNELNQIISM